MVSTFSRIWSMSRIIQATPFIRPKDEMPLGEAILKNDGLRYGLFAVGSPLIAVWITFWVFTDLPYYLPDAPIRISYYRDLGSQGIAYGTGIIFGGIIGIPLMLVLVMPYSARLLEMGELRFRYYLVPAIVIGPIFAGLIFPVLFGLGDGLGFAMPTLCVCILTMTLVYVGYVLGDPNVTTDRLLTNGQNEKQKNLPSAEETEVNSSCDKRS